MNAEQIPPEVVEAAARAIEAADVGMVPSYEEAAHAAIAAGLAAWPGATAKQANEHVALFNMDPALILPLPQEARDEN